VSRTENHLTDKNIVDDVDEFSLENEMRRPSGERAELADWYGFAESDDWAGLDLSEHDIAYLRQRAVPATVARKRGLHTIDSCSALPDLDVGSWTTAQRAHLDSRGVEALVLPWYREFEQSSSSYELKWNVPRLVLDDKGKVESTVKAEFPGGAKDGLEDGDLHIDGWSVEETGYDPTSRVPVASENWEVHQTATLITEGVCKGDALRVQADLEGIPVRVLSMRGVHQGLRGKNRRETFKPQPSEALDVVLESEGPVVLVFDPDARDNIAVRNALVQSAQVIEECSFQPGRRVFILDVPAPVSDIGGVDDYLAYAREEAERLSGFWNRPWPSVEVAEQAERAYYEATEPLFHMLAAAVPWREWARQTETYEHDDVGRADRIAAEFLDRQARYAHGVGLLAWDGTRYVAQDGNSFGLTVARECADRVMCRSGKKGTALQRSLARTKGALDRALMLATADPRLDVDAGQLDANPLELNTQDGIVNLADGTNGPHDPAALHTKVTACGFDPDMLTPTWDAFLTQVFVGDTEAIAFFYAWAGSVLVGRPETAEGLLIAFGAGQNGKSTLFNLLTRMLDTYAVTVSTNILAGDDRDHERIRLRGARLVILPEPPTRWSIDAGALKQTFSRDAVTARALYKDPVTFWPTHTGVVFANALPTITASDDGTWRRLNFMPFDYRVDKADVDRSLADKLWDERDGIMARLVEGAVTYVTSGLPDSTANETFKNSYREEADWLAAWVAEACEPAPDGMLDRAMAYRAYLRWLGDNDLSTNISSKAWGRQMQERGFVERGEKKSDGRRYFIGQKFKTWKLPPTKGAPNSGTPDATETDTATADATGRDQKTAPHAKPVNGYRASNQTAAEVSEGGIDSEMF